MIGSNRKSQQYTPQPLTYGVPLVTLPARGADHHVEHVIVVRVAHHRERAAKFIVPVVAAQLNVLTW